MTIKDFLFGWLNRKVSDANTVTSRPNSQEVHPLELALRNFKEVIKADLSLGRENHYHALGVYPKEGMVLYEATNLKQRGYKYSDLRVIGPTFQSSESCQIGKHLCLNARPKLKYLDGGVFVDFVSSTGLPACYKVGCITYDVSNRDLKVTGEVPKTLDTTLNLPSVEIDKEKLKLGLCNAYDLLALNSSSRFLQDFALAARERIKPRIPDLQSGIYSIHPEAKPNREVLNLVGLALESRRFNGLERRTSEYGLNQGWQETEIDSPTALGEVCKINPDLYQDLVDLARYGVTSVHFGNSPDPVFNLKRITEVLENHWRLRYDHSPFNESYSNNSDIENQPLLKQDFLDGLDKCDPDLRKPIFVVLAKQYLPLDDSEVLDSASKINSRYNRGVKNEK